MFKVLLQQQVRVNSISSTFVKAARMGGLRFSSAAANNKTYFTSDHEWISVDAKGEIGTFGITDYAQKALGDVVYIEVPSVGDAVQKKDQIGAVESVKAASDIYSPVSGSVVAVNESLEKEPSLINNSPYVDGWIAKIKLSKANELSSLLSEEEYNKLIE